MAFVSGLGGNHISAHFSQKRGSISAHKVEDCGCIQFSLKKKPKKRNKMRLMKERIRQFSIWFFENEDHKEVEHVRRRQERKRKRKLVSRGNKHRGLLLLYGFDVILWIIGLVFTLCSSVKTFGKNTRFYRSRHLYRLLGPVFLFAAVLILFLATALKHRMRKKSRKPQRPFYIVQKKKKTSKSDIQMKDPDNDSGNEEDIEMDVTKKQKLFELESEIDKENLAIAKTILKSDKDWSGEFSFECTKLVEQSEVMSDDKNLKRVKDRKAWAKTKWMRVDTESDEDVEVGDIMELTPIESAEYEEGIGTVENAETGVRPKYSGKRRITRFKPISGSCFSAQSSIKSQTSEMSCTSTTSESAPLFRK